jgi:hypothetical protein
MHQSSRNYLQMVHEHRPDSTAQAPLHLTLSQRFMQFHVSRSGIGARTAIISVFLFCPRMIDFLFPTITPLNMFLSSRSLATTCNSPSSLSPVNFRYSTPLSPLIWRLIDFPARNISSLHCLFLTIVSPLDSTKWGNEACRMRRMIHYLIFPQFTIQY